MYSIVGTTLFKEGKKVKDFESHEAAVAEAQDRAKHDPKPSLSPPPDKKKKEG